MQKTGNWHYETLAEKKNPIKTKNLILQVAACFVLSKTDAHILGDEKVKENHPDSVCIGFDLYFLHPFQRAKWQDNGE